MLQGDLEERGLEIGDEVEVADPIGTVTVTGSYTLPEDEGEFWFDLSRFASSPRQVEPAHRRRHPLPPRAVRHRAEHVRRAADRVVGRPGRPAVRRPARPHPRRPRHRDRHRRDARAGGEDRRTDNDGYAGPGAPRARRSFARTVAADEEGGPLVGDSVNDLPLIAAEVRDQQATARASITPAVISLVLVALALLLRLLMAAADLRLPEIALASLRGLTRAPAVAARALRTADRAGAVGADRRGRRGRACRCCWCAGGWCPGCPLPLPWTAWLAGLLVVVAAVGVAVLAVGLVLRVSLSEQLTGVRRPHASSRAAVLAQLLLVAAAAARCWPASSRAAPRASPTRTDLVLPVLLALVAGVAATRLTSRCSPPGGPGGGAPARSRRTSRRGRSAAARRARW